MPGTGTLTITGIDSTTIQQPTRTISFTFDEPATTQKTWIAYETLISPDATNLAGAEHTFSLTVQQDRGDGAGFIAVPDGTQVAVTLSNPSTLVSDSCATGTVGGTCTIVVDSADPGTTTVTPGAITVQLLDGSGATVPVVVEPGSPAYETPDSATKTWVGFRLGVSPDGANLVGEAHTFTITAEYAVEQGVWQPLTEGEVEFDWTSTVGEIVPADTTCPTLTTAGTCTVTVSSTVAGSGTIEVTGLASATVTVDGVETTFTDVNATSAPDAVEFTTATATKTWAAYLVTITPSASNPVGTAHVFTITATTGGTPVEGAVITYTWSGAGVATPPDECTTTAAGTCTVSVTSPSSGTGTLTVESLTHGDLMVDLTEDGAPGQDPDQDVPLEASKTWLAYRVLLEDDATNLVGESHTFTATVQQTDDDGVTWAAVPDGTTLTATTAGEGTLNGPASTCVTGGTVDGMCTFIVTDAGPGTLDLTVTAIAGTDVDGTPFTNIALTTPASTAKTWVSVAVTVTPPTATNVVGEPHTFTVDVDMLDGDGDPDAGPVADGTIVAWVFDGPGILDAAGTTCDEGTTGGTCEIVFDNSAAGVGTLTITSVTLTILDSNGEPLTVDFTTAGPGQAPGQAIPPTAEKSWGVNLTIVKESSADSPQTFSFETTGFLPPDDQPFDLAIGESQEFAGLLPGVYTIAELVDAANLPVPWRFESFECTGLDEGSTVTGDGAVATLTIGGEQSAADIVCTFTNELFNLVVDKDDGGATAVGGGPPFDYTITVSNIGSVATAAPITVTDTLPTGLSFAGAPTLPNGVSCDAPAGSTLTCIITASIEPGGSVQLVVPVRAAVGAPSPAINSVTINSSEDPLCPDCPPPPQCVPAASLPAGAVGAPVVLAAIAGGDPNDNQDCESTPIVGTTLQILKSDGDVTATPGGTFRYTITVTNLGPGAATGVTMTDDIPNELAVVGMPTGAGWACAVTGRDAQGFDGIVTCTLQEPLAPATAAPPITVEVRLGTGVTDPVTNYAVVVSNETPTPVGSTATTPVQTPPNPTSPMIPFTGANSARLLEVAFPLLLFGGFLVLYSRGLRRRTRDSLTR